MDLPNDGRTNAEKIQALRDRMNEKIATLESTKKHLDEEIDELEKRMWEIIDFLTGSRKRRTKARKMVLVSLAIAASSFIYGIQSNLASRSSAPFSIGLGVGSLACSLVYLKDVWYTCTNFAKSSILKNLLYSTDEKTALNILSALDDIATGNHRQAAI